MKWLKLATFAVLMLAGCGSGEPLCRHHEWWLAETKPARKQELQSQMIEHIQFTRTTTRPMPTCPRCVELMAQLAREGR